MDVSDEVRELGTPIAERLRSPLIGSFVVAWCLWNAPVFLLALTGEANAKDRLAWIQSYLEIGGVWSVLVPLVSALTYVFVYPHARRRIAVYVETQRKIERDQLWTIHAQTPVLPQAHERVRDDVRRLKDENAKLRDEIDTVNKQRLAAEAGKVDADNRETAALQRIRELENPPKPDTPADAPQSMNPQQLALAVQEHLNWLAGQFDVIAGRRDLAREALVVEAANDFVRRSLAEGFIKQFTSAVEHDGGDPEPLARHFPDRDRDPGEGVRFRCAVRARALRRLGGEIGPGNIRKYFVTMPPKPDLATS